MPSAPATPALVQTLPYVAWLLLASLAFGSFAFAYATRQLSDATPGYVRFVALTSAVLSVLALAVGGSLTGSDALIVKPGTDMGLAGLATATFAVIGLLFAISLGNRRVASGFGLAASAIALVVLARAALAWVPTTADAVPLLVQMVILSLATGGSLAAIVLGHWYLVTPKISERPLILQCRMLLAVIGLQVLLFVTWTTLGGGPGQAAFSVFSTGPVLLVVLRLIVTLLFPLVLVYMAWRTAQTRSMESATGLLYINFAAVLAGTIGAAAMYVSSGVLV